MKQATHQAHALVEITEDTANAATATIARHARSRAELSLFMRMIAPAPHSIGADPSDRRATPRWNR